MSNDFQSSKLQKNTNGGCLVFLFKIFIVFILWLIFPSNIFWAIFLGLVIGYIWWNS